MAGPSAWLVLLRGGHDAALIALAGALAFGPCVLGREAWPRLAPALRRLAGTAGGLALVLGCAWFVAEAGSVAGAPTPSAAIAAIPAFVAYLAFARVLLARLVLIVLALLLLRAPLLALAAAVGAAALQPWLGHPGQTGGALAASESLHLLAASVWLGGLGPLLLCLARLPSGQAAAAFRRFTHIGLVAVLVLAGTGLAQGFVLAGGVAGLAGTPYGRVALAKAALFALALLLAARNGLVLTGRLERDPPTPGALRISVRAELLIAVAIVLLAAWLAGLPPGASL